MGTTNIPQNIIKAIIAIIAIDDLQLSGGPLPALFRWQIWKWLQIESDDWTGFRNILEPLLQPYINKKTITSEQRDLVKTTVKAARDYAGYGPHGHRLLLKIAAFGDNHDWEVANIKLGTPLAKKPGKAKSDSTALKQPSLKIKYNILGEMMLTVLDPDNPTSVGLPAGMKFAKVYLYIGSVAPKNVNDYVFYGNAKRGKLSVKFTNIENSGTIKLYAYFIARYESNKGELGQPCGMVSAEIILL